MLALTHGAPKELLEIGGRAVVVRVMEECAASGITDVLIVISPEKEEMIDILAALAGQDGMPETIVFAVQHEPKGLADAIRVGRDFAELDALAVALPDNLFAGAEPGLKQVIDTHNVSRKNVVAMVEIFAADAERRGPTSVYPGYLKQNEYVIERIPGKGERGKTFDTGGAASAFTGVGRYVFYPEVFDLIDLVERRLPAGAELDDVPVMQRLLDAGMLTGRRIEGRFFDVGLVSGYEEANAEFGAWVEP